MLKIFNSSKQKQIFIIWETRFSKQNKNSWRKQLIINEKIKFSMEEIWWRVRKISWEEKITTYITDRKIEKPWFLFLKMDKWMITKNKK